MSEQSGNRNRKALRRRHESRPPRCQNSGRSRGHHLDPLSPGIQAGCLREIIPNLGIPKEQEKSLTQRSKLSNRTSNKVPEHTQSLKDKMYKTRPFASPLPHNGAQRERPTVLEARPGMLTYPLSEPTAALVLRPWVRKAGLGSVWALTH